MNPIIPLLFAAPQAVDASSPKLSVAENRIVMSGGTTMVDQVKVKYPTAQGEATDGKLDGVWVYAAKGEHKVVCTEPESIDKSSTKVTMTCASSIEGLKSDQSVKVNGLKGEGVYKFDSFKVEIDGVTKDAPVKGMKMPG